MSSSIDQRIVEMQFDNADFERGIQTSLKSIKNLDKSLELKDSAKGFENLGKAANNVSFDGLNAGVVAVQQKFSAMEIVAISALQNIVNRAMAAGESLVKSLSLDQITAGFEKFSSKTTSVATLVAQGYNIDEVSQQLDRLNTFTDETSYNFTDMVANIAKFTATGKNLTESVTAMEGIANWAAMSGQNAQTASRAMYQLAQAMGAGVMRLEDYKSIQNASMDTDEFRKKCIAAAVSLGTLKDNGNETYSVVSKGANATAFNVSQFTTQLTEGAWLTSDVMMNVFNDYSKAVSEIVDASEAKTMTVSEVIEEIHSKSEKEGISLDQSIKDLGYTFDEFSLKAFEAAQKARTFNDAIDSVKDAVSTGWMKTFEIIFGNANEATDLWTDFANDLYDIFAEGGNARNDFLEEVMGDSKAFTQEQWDIVDQNNSANHALQNALMETAKEHGIAIDEMVNDQTTFRESLKQGWLTTDIFTETLKKFTSETVSSTTDLTGKLEEYKKLASEVIQGNYGNGEARKKALADAGQDYATIQGIVNKMLAGTEISVEDLGEAQLKAIGYTDEQVVCLQKLAKQAEETGTPINELIESMNRPSGRELLIDSFRNTLHGLMTVINTVKEAWSNVFPAPSAEKVYNILEAVNKFTQVLNISNEVADKLKRTFQGLFSVLGIASDVVSAFGGRAFKILGAVLGDVKIDVLDFTANVGDNIVKLRQWIRSNETVNRVLDTCTESIINGVKHLKDWIRNNKTLNGIIEKCNTILGNGVTAIKKWTAEHKVVSTVLDKISAAFSRLIGWLGKAKTKLGEWFTAFKQLPIVQAAVETFWSLAEKALNGAKQLLSDLQPYIAEFFEKIKNLDGISFEDIVGFFISLKEDAGGALQALLDKFSGINGAIDTFKQKVSDMAGFAKEKFSGLTTIISTVRDLASKGLKNVAVDKIITAGVGVGVIASLKKLSDVLGGVKKMGANIGDSFVGVLGGVKNVLTAYQKDIEANSIIKIAAAIGILSLAIIALAQVPTEKMIPAAIALGIVGSAMMGLAVVFEAVKGKFGSKDSNPMTALSQTLKGFASGFNAVAITASVLLIVRALKEMESLDTDGLKTRIVALVAIVGTLGLVGIAMSKLSGNQFGSALYLIAMAFSLKTVIKALADLQEYSLDSIWSSLGKMSLILGALALVCKAASGAKFGSAVTLIAAAFSLKMLVDVLNDVAQMPFEDILKGLSALIPIMGMMALVNASARKSEKGGSAGQSILLMATGLFIMVEAIKAIAEIDPADLAKGTLVLTALIGIISIYSIASRKANENSKNAGEGILAMSAGIGILTVCIMALSQIPIAQIGKAFIAITGLMAGFGLLMKSMSKSGGDYKAIIAMTASIAALTILMTVLSALTPDKLAQTVIALDSILVCFGILMKASESVKGSSAGIVMLTLAVAAIGGLLYALASMPDPDAVLPVAESLSLVLLAVSGAMKLLSKLDFKDIAHAGTGILVGVGVIFAIMEALGGLMTNEFLASNMDRGIEAIGKIGDAIGTFVGNIFASLGSSMARALPDISRSISEFAVNLVPFTTVMRTINKKVLDGAVNLSEALLAITAAEFISGIGSFLSGDLDFSALKEKFTNLGEGVAAFCEQTKDLDSSTVVSATLAAKALASLLEALPSTGGTLQDWLGDKQLDDFGNTLKTFASGLVAYSDVITGADGGNGLNTAAVEASKGACEMLVDLENSLPSTGGKFQQWFGEQSLGDLGDNLKGFAEGMVAYSNALTKDGGIDTEAITSSEAACDMLVGLAQSVNELTGEKGLKAFLSSSETLGKFAKDIGQFGENLKTFSDNIAGADFDKISKAVTNLQRLVGILKDLNAENVNTGALTNLGLALNSFDPNSTFFDLFSQGFDKMEEAGATFIQKFIDGVVSKATEVTDTASQTVSNFTGGITTAIQSSVPLVTVEVDNMMVAVEAAITNHEPTVSEAFNSLLTAIINKFKERQGEFTAEGDADAQGYAEGVQNSEAPGIAVQSMTDEAARTIHGKSPRFAEAGSASATAVSTGWSANTAPVQAVSTTMDASVQNIRDRNADFTAAGEESGSAVAQGMLNKQGDATGNIATILTSCLEKINAMREDWFTAGTNVIAGFIDGMKEKIADAAEAAAEMANKALTSAKEALGIHSPSKEFGWLAKMSGEGYVNGMQKMLARVAKSGADMGNTAVSSTQMALQGFADLLDNGIDTEPTIRPVIDLSDVEAGLTTLNGLVTGQRTLQLAGSVNRVKAVARRMNPTTVTAESDNQNGSSVTNYNFNQNNYSPKALSRSEIYRDSKNLFASMKRRGTSK